MKTFGVSVALLCAACGGPVGIVRGDIGGETWLVAVSTRASLTGRVLDERGNGIAGAYVLTEPRGFESQADDKGRYTLPWLPAGELGVVAVAPGWAPLRGARVELVEGGEHELDLQLAERLPQGLVTVTVTDPKGEPVADALVTVSDGSSAMSDELGVARLEGVVGEGLTLQVVDAGEDLWTRTLEDVDLAGGGGLQWSPQLAGRPDGEVEYFGDGWCARCHGDLVDAFSATPHGRAFEREPSGALAERLDDGLILELGDASLELLIVDGAVQAWLTDAIGGLVEAPVVGFLGSVDSQSVPLVEFDGQRFPLPAVWVAPRDTREGFPCSESALLPFETERWLDDDDRLVFEDAAPDAARSAEALCLPCHVSGYTLALRDDGGVDMSFEDEPGWQDDGVSCERCHGPGESHLFSMSASDVVQPGLLDSARANEVCAQCHSRTEGAHSGLPHPFGEERPFQPGEWLEDTTLSAPQAWPSGAAAAGHMQHNELLDNLHGPTGADLRCVDCHEVHGEHGAVRPSLLRATVDDNALCEGCHLQLSFDGDTWTAAEHMGHRFYDPSGAQEAGRCVLCHMPATATDAGWCEQTGSGSLSSHRFEALSPQHTVDAFEDLGVQVAELGEVPPHACADCHAWNAWYFDSLGLGFRGPQGDPAELETHEAFLSAHGGMFP